MTAQLAAIFQWPVTTPDAGEEDGWEAPESQLKPDPRDERIQEGRRMLRSDESIGQIGQSTESVLQPAYPASLATSSSGKRKAKHASKSKPHKQPKVSSSTEPSSQTASKDVTVARQTLAQRWGDEITALTNWEGLDSYVFIGDREDQEPYAILGELVSRVQSFGTPKARKAFAQGVCAWLRSGQMSQQQMEAPDHLKDVGGYNPGPFQRFWKAMKIAQGAHQIESMAILLRRKANVDLILAYREAIQEIRSTAAKCKGRLKQGEKAAAKARLILYQVVYPDIEERDKARQLFNYQQVMAAPYIGMIEHYGNQGILAMMPAKIPELDLRGKSRLTPLIQLLDLVHPEFHEDDLQLYSNIIDTVAENRTLGNDTLAILEQWASFQI